jgi:hypothetical protein
LKGFASGVTGFGSGIRGTACSLMAISLLWTTLIYHAHYLLSRDSHL